MKEFIQPTRKKIFLLLFILIALSIINSFYLMERVGCFPAECPQGGYPSIHRPYYDCGRCEAPSLKEEIIGYGKIILFEPITAVHRIKPPIFAFVSFISGLILYYILSCFLNSLRDIYLRKR